ncbi:GLPGLI family protein [Luteibaculum oceani]|uniref:GLPGLI family protein n=1 Tax=Luteibaculum oceani TaxID=1294296 RepID=A0A5C6USC0_9FLAO|nr:GLPGLI family protein [Luteibaculum oceani]TXC75564.1 GLPGLI family protein [Luteibaculum oceani]
MKLYLSLIIALLTGFSGVAQLTEGRIVYQEKIDVHAKLPERAKQFKDMIPRYKEFNKELLFNADLSKYQSPEVEEDEVVEKQQGGMHMRFKQMKDNSEVVHDIKEQTRVELKEFMGRNFVVVDENEKPFNWKIGAGQKEILGYVCQEAIHYGEKDTILAWFTPQIPVSTGPRGVGKLPGMILGLELDNGLVTVMATKIEEQEVDAKTMSIKGKGKKVTKEEFKAIVEEKTKEMEEQHGGNGMVIRVAR